MANGTTCTCKRCSLRGLMGPVVVITIGVLFLLQQMHVASLNRLWPVILLAIGVVKLLQETASTEGHTGSQPPSQPPPPPPPAS
jgi:hypothetical protein